MAHGQGPDFCSFRPSWERIAYPIGSDPATRCREIWYYGGFPVVFVDSTCTGQYRLLTYDLTELRNLNLMYMHEFSKAQNRALEALEKAIDLFDFNWRVKKDIVAEDRVNGMIEIDIPNDVIWFNVEDDILKTVMEVRLELKDFGANPIWTYEEAFEISIRDDEIGEKKGKRHKIEIPFTLTEELNRLRLGKNLLYSVVRNRTDNEEAKKVMEFNL